MKPQSARERAAKKGLSVVGAVAIKEEDEPAFGDGDGPGEDEFIMGAEDRMRILEIARDMFDHQPDFETPLDLAAHLHDWVLMGGKLPS